MVAEARLRDGGLWQCHVRLMVCVAPWLIADSSQYSVLFLNLFTPITLSWSLTLCLSHFFFFFFKFYLKQFPGLKVLMGLKKKNWVGLGGPGKGWLGLKYYI